MDIRYECYFAVLKSLFLFHKWFRVSGLFLFFEVNLSDSLDFIGMELLEVELKVFHRNGEIRLDCRGYLIMPVRFEIATRFAWKMFAIGIKFKLQGWFTRRLDCSMAFTLRWNRAQRLSEPATTGNDIIQLGFGVVDHGKFCPSLASNGWKKHAK